METLDNEGIECQSQFWNNSSQVDVIRVISFAQVASKYVDLEISAEGKAKIRGGICGNILLDLCTIMNKSFSLEVMNSPLSNFPNGSLGQTGDMIRSGQADLTIGWWDIYPYRAKALQTLHPFSSYRLTAFFVQPPTSSIRNLFIEPFTTGVWTLFGFVIIIGMVFGAFYHCLHRPFRELPDVFTICTWFYGIAVQQPFHKNSVTRHGVSLRIALATLMICVLIFWSHYFGAIIKSLMANVTPVKKVHDFGNQMRFTFSTYPTLLEFLRGTSINNGHSSHTHVKGEETSIYRSLHEELYINLSNSFVRVFDGDHIYIDSPFVARTGLTTLNLSDLDYCRRISSIPALSTNSKVTFYTWKNSPLIEPLNRGLLIVLERGLVSRYRMQLDANNIISCLHKVHGYDADLSLKDVIIGFFILVVGTAIAIGVLFVEFGLSFRFLCKTHDFIV